MTRVSYKTTSSTCPSATTSVSKYLLTHTNNHPLTQPEVVTNNKSILDKTGSFMKGISYSAFNIYNIYLRLFIIFLCLLTAAIMPAFGQQAAQPSATDSVTKAYLQLKLYHQFYSQIDAEQRWTYFPADTVIRPGQASDLIYGIRSNLLLTGDLSATQDLATNTLDSLLVKALAKFQFRHGLTTDGIFGNSTLQAMNVPVSKRVEQISINMERWRTYTGVATQPYIFVNIPDFTLQVIEGDSVALKMKVIVGKKTSKTVLMQSEVKYIVLNPSWNVPQGIAAKEILPLLKKNPHYLTDHQMRIYSKQAGQRTEIHPDSVDWQSMTPANFHYLVEQIPGETNALGKVKFIFPNEYDIYLHDTAQRGLFSKTVRAMSHGCVRVEKPIELAAFLLRNDAAWSAKKINEFIAKGTESTGIRLRTPVPVSINYFTAWTDNNSQLHFRNDIYNYDIPVTKPALSSLTSKKIQAD
ncbi:L,D-transpeptidase family protein [Rhodocytophaga rosea]|uniref:L,D-transpeptidase family protein n=1 Tax=Rhodocytophaga rosea TaxID=2704465 RepID=A0A6C0GIQ8_9BACT|nr:L,D-transpeptidase family protein [Rhodocytophaga rosea]QHT67610.1 L,D-transpeptidase family protein [Rhodocytophaga rosea]